MRTPVAIFALVLFVAVGCGGGGSSKPAESPADKSGESTASSSSSSFKPPGTCVDVVSDGDTHDSTRPFDKHVQLDVRDFDLDGDGVVDAFVKPAWACGNSCNRSAYVVRGTCGHWVGTFPSVDRYEALDSKTNGLKDLSVRPRREEEDGQLHCYNVILKYDGTEYKEAKRRECECKEEGAKCTAWNE